ncbi:MAG: hypothetical protein WC815_08310 [Vicinamibacterales bacterium]|jgi:hypothetical protein
MKPSPSWPLEADQPAASAANLFCDDLLGPAIEPARPPRPADSSAAHLFDGVVFRGISPNALLPVRDDEAVWEAVALPRSATCRCALRPGALVVERALGENRLASTHVLGEDIQVEELYGADGRIRESVLVLARRERASDLPAVVMPSLEAAEDDRSFLRWSPGARAYHFPARDAAAPGGHAFMATTGGEAAPTPAEWPKREEAMVRQLLAGNMPDKLLQWVTIGLTYKDKSRTVKATLQVLPDYLAVGHDADFVHVPLDPVSAQLVADRFDCLLPTARICDAIYSQAKHQLRALNRDYYNTDANRKIAKRGRAQTSTAAYIEHSDAVREQMKKAGITPGEFVAGHKKDVVIARSLHGNSERIAFQGFYDKDGFPFEPCYENAEQKPKPSCAKDLPTLAHSRRFADYAQGVRLVHPWMTVDDKKMAVADVLADPTLSFLISAEGPIVPPRIPKTVKPKLGPLELVEVGDSPVGEVESPIEHAATDSSVAVEPATALGTARTTSPIATVSPQRQINEMLDRELILIAQARIVADWFMRRLTATFEELAADPALTARLDVSKDGPLLDRIRPFPNRKLPDRRGQLFTTDEALRQALAPPRDAARLWPILDVLHHYGVVLLVPNTRDPFGRPTVMASLTRLTAELTRMRFDAESVRLEQRAVAFKRAVASQGTLHHVVGAEPIPRAWSAAKVGETLEIARSIVTLLGRVRDGHQQWRAGTYPRHWWNDFSVDIFIAAALEKSGFWARAAVRGFFAALDTACAGSASPGPYAWKAIYNDEGLAREMNGLYGEGRVLFGVDGHGPGPRMHIHLDLRPLVVPFDATTGFWRHGARVVLSPPPPAP